MKTTTTPYVPPFSARTRVRTLPISLSAIESRILIGLLVDRREFSRLPARPVGVHPEVNVSPYSIRVDAAKLGFVKIDVGAWFGHVSAADERRIFAAADRLEALGLIARTRYELPGNESLTHVEGYRRLTEAGHAHAIAEQAFAELRATMAGRTNSPPPRKPNP